MSSHRSSHHSSSSSKGKGHSSSSRAKPKKDDWSDITDPEERRRVQNRIAQRKFRDKAKEAKERQDRDAENQAHAASSYVTPDPNEMGEEDDLSGLPWGSLNLRHVVSQGRARQEEPRRRGSRREDDRSQYDERSYYDERGHYDERSHYDERGQYEAPIAPVYSEENTYYEADTTYYEAEDPAYEDQTYYDYRSGSGSGHGSSTV